MEGGRRGNRGGKIAYAWSACRIKVSVPPGSVLRLLPKGYLLVWLTPGLRLRLRYSSGEGCGSPVANLIATSGQTGDVASCRSLYFWRWPFCWWFFWGRNGGCDMLWSATGSSDLT